jgi:hypothetical protein
MSEEQAMDEGETAETIVEFLANGGTIALTGRRGPGGTWVFEVVVGEAERRAILGDDEEGLEPYLPTGPVGTWEEALALLDCYAWAISPPTLVHPEFRQAVWAALVERSQHSDEPWADLVVDWLPEWEEVCLGK